MAITEDTEPSLPDTSPFAAGMFVTPHVRLVEPMAMGGMGELWVARHLTLATDVVVKFVRSRYHGHPVALARFRREARAAARIASPHVVRHFDHGLTEAQIPYIVMERLTGLSLAELVRDKGHLSLAQTVEIVRQLGRALSEAHAAGIIHRDIKPENVFLCDVSEGLHVKLLDFGVAASTGIALAGTLTQPGTLVGTPSYLSPELVLHDIPADEHADLWAVSALAYEALTGYMAFDGETVGAVCSAVARCEVIPPSHHNPDLSPEVDQWFARALCFDRAQRFQTAHELALSFMELANGEPPTSARPHPEIAPRSVSQGVLDDDLADPTLGAAAVSRRPPPPPRRWALPVAALLLGGLLIGGSRALLDVATGRSGPFFQASVHVAHTMDSSRAALPPRPVAAPTITVSTTPSARPPGRLVRHPLAQPARVEPPRPSPAPARTKDLGF